MKESCTDYLYKNLPAVYRKDGKEGFLYRFLSIFGDCLQEIELKIDGIHNFINPDKTRADLLPWLASWTALELDETWPESKRRKLIRKVVDLYRWRGTIEGIKMFVEVYTGIRPEIIEAFKESWRIGVRSTVGEDIKMYDFQEDPYSFYIKLNSFEELSYEQKRKILAVVELQKPAYTKVIHHGWFPSFWQIGIRSTVGRDIGAGEN